MSSPEIAGNSRYKPRVKGKLKSRQNIKQCRSTQLQWGPGLWILGSSPIEPQHLAASLITSQDRFYKEASCPNLTTTHSKRDKIHAVAIAMFVVAIYSDKPTILCFRRGGYWSTLYVPRKPTANHTLYAWTSL